jgi:DNA-binding response OmpR family regulator
LRFPEKRGWGGVETPEEKIVVYIEDELELIDLLSLILKDEKITVKPALRGREGLDLVRQLKPDLVLLDLMLPDMEGWDVFREMQQDASLRDIPVIVITVRIEGLIDGVWPQTEQLAGYVVKPFTVHELRAAIRHALGLASELAS